MALTRSQLVTWLAGRMQDVLTVASMAAADTQGDLKEPVDETFLALGAAEADLATAAAATGDEQPARAYARYFVLDRAVDALHSKMDVTSAGAGAKLNQQIANLERQRARALHIAQGYGLAVGAVLVVVPYAGGISQTDYDTRAADADRIHPFFARDDVSIRGVDDVLDAEFA